MSGKDRWYVSGKDRWYVIDADGCIQLYTSESEAKREANELFKYYKSEAYSNGWPEGVGQLEWGNLATRATVEVEVHGEDEWEAWDVHMKDVNEEWPFGLDDEQQKALEVIAGLMRKAKQ